MYGRPWNIQFAPQKTSLLLISLKSEISSHPPLFLNHTWIPKFPRLKFLDFYLILLLPGRNISIVYSVVGNNVWVNFTVTDHFLVVRVLPLPINLGLGPHWNMVLFCTLEQLSLIWPTSTASRPALRTCAGSHFHP